MSLLHFLLRSSWYLVMLCIFVGLLSGLAGTAVIAFIHTTMGANERTNLLAWSFLAASVVVVATKALSEVLLARLGQESIAELRMRLSRTILDAPLRHMEELGHHRLLMALKEDAETIANAYVQLPLIFVNSATVLGCLVYLGWLSWQLFAVVLGFMAIGGAMFRLYQRKALHYLKQARETSDALFHQFRSILEGIRELKIHRGRRQAFFATVLGPTVSSYKREFIAGMTMYSVASSWGAFLFYGVIGFVLFVLSSWLDLSEQTVTGSTLILLYMMGPFSQVVERLQSIGRANIALKKVETLGSSLTAPVTTTSIVKNGGGDIRAKAELLVSNGWRRLDFVGVTHRYYHELEERSFCLGPIDLSFSRGEVVFLIGGNGSGKTTLAMLLLGLYTPEDGAICLDRISVDESNREEYRQLFSAVFSDFHLFDQLLGISEPGLDNQTKVYLELLQLSSKVHGKNGMLSTLALSRGQRKRLALLTAYLEDRPFYVFDEWAADQDPVFRKVFYTELLPDLKARGKTVLVITHDDQYFSVADRCVRMDFGKIVDVLDRVSISH